MKPSFDDGGSILDHVIEHLAKHGAQQGGPYVPRLAVRWNAKVIEFPVLPWDQDRRRAVARQAMDLASKAKQECGND